MITSPSRLGAACLALTLLTGLGTARAATEPPQEAATGPAATATTPTTVTLVTGDKVLVDPTGGSTVIDPGDGVFTQLALNGDEYVIPAEAAPFLGATLDVRLFNVSYLVRAGLDDAHADALPVKVEAGGVATLGRQSGSLPKKDAEAFGRELAGRWKAGQKPGAGRITLAPPQGAPALPADPMAGPTAARSDYPDYHTVTVDSVDRDGKPGVMLGTIHSLDDPTFTLFQVGSGVEGTSEAVFSVPEGDYSIEASVLTGPVGDLSSTGALVIEPEFSVEQDLSLTLDARKAVPYEATFEGVPGTGRTQYDLITYNRTTVQGEQVGNPPFGNSVTALFLMRLVSGGDFGVHTLYATPTRRVTKGSLDFLAMTSIGGPGGNDPTYKAAFHEPGGVPASLTRTVRRADLTTVESTIHNTPGATSQHQELLSMVYLPWTQTTFGVTAPLDGGKRTDYWYSNAPGEVVWEPILRPDLGLRLLGERRLVRPGQRVAETWNKGPQVPSSSAPYTQEALIGLQGTPDTNVTSALRQVCVACRQDDLALLYLNPYADSTAGHYRSALDGLARVEFYRDGALAFTSATRGDGLRLTQLLDLPLLPEPAEYRLKVTGDNPGVEDATSTTDWTFRTTSRDRAADLPDSAQCAPDPTRRCSFLPLLFVRPDLLLDIAGATPADRPFEVAFTVRHQQYQADPRGVKATVSVSYDGGTTWSQPQPATRGRDGRFTTTLAAPGGGEYAALRIKAVDRDGNAVEQTNLRAYRLAPKDQ
ncbi:hypothetical protein MF672_015925 [Actinomadura sp. ATCC 31491]|uniref:Exo-alpha-sialidase n=1 Tax=Actinomadura luzonensis TaxID=2805427 RepID=A0ABT0FTE4_9ACTN|nr:hypothetical protein [Actinomadura luzonensis]MCK2215265.1 hypothetical protein [Actinomadura luzonensis]